MRRNLQGCATATTVAGVRPQCRVAWSRSWRGLSAGRRRLLAATVGAFFFAAAPGAGAHPGAPGTPGTTERVIVSTRGGAASRTVVRNHGGRVASDLRAVNGAVADVTSRARVALQTDPNVTVSPNLPMAFTDLAPSAVAAAEQARAHRST